jgi:hypothetical protein
MKFAAPVVQNKPYAWHLHRKLATMEPGRSYNVIHASDLTQKDYCPRRQALHKITKTPFPAQRATTSDQVTWHLGRIIQESLAQWFADLGMAFGYWRCRNCKTTSDFGRRPVKCNQCHSDLFAYVEARGKDPETGASCGLDLFVKREDGALHLIEVKSILKDKFKTLEMPLGEHRVRTQLYLEIIKRDPFFGSMAVHTKAATVFYFCKSGYGTLSAAAKQWSLPNDGAFSPFKEFTVGEDPENVDYLFKLSADANTAMLGGPLSGRTCMNMFDKKAQKCDVCSQCFTEYD